MKKFVSFMIIVCAAALIIPAAACSNDGADRTSYEINAVYDPDSGALSAECAVTYLNDTTSEVSELKFNIYGNAYRQGALYSPVSDIYTSRAYYAGTSYGNMEITDVSGCSGWEVCGEDMNVLDIKLSSPLKSGATAKIVISYRLNLAKVNHRTGITRHTVNLGNFYPVLCARTDGEFYECVYYSDGDPFLSECADYTVNISLPQGYTAATSGKLYKTSSSDENTVYGYKLQNARDFAMVLSDEFSTLTAESGGTTVTYYYYEDDDAQAKLDAAVQSLEFYRKNFGDYVYPTLSVVQTGFATGGMEYPALTMINGDLDKDTAIYTIVHENAHQWWYAMVGNNQIENAWQDEGLTEYSTVMFFENNTSYGITRTALISSAIEAYRSYYTVYSQIFGDADTTMSRNLKDFVSDYEYVNIAYNKAMIMFEMLRTSIGDAKFLSGLKNYYSDCIYTIASPENLFASFKNTGVDLESFFEGFIQGKIVI